MWWFLGLVTGLVVAGIFWDDIREWYTEQVDAWRKELGRFAIVLDRGFIEIDKVMTKARRIVKRAIAYIQVKEKVYKKTTTEEIDHEDLPEDVQESLRRRKRVAVPMTLEN